MIENARRNETEVITAGESIPSQRENRLQHLREKRFAHPAEAEAGQSDPELAGRQICVEITCHRLRLGGADTSLVRQRFELADPDFDQSKLRRDEKAVQEDEHRDGAQLAQDQPGRIPMFSDALGERRQGQKR